MTHTTVPAMLPDTPAVHAKLAAIEAELASTQATLDGMLADAELWDARAAERAATIRPAVNAAMDAVEDTVRRPRVWPVALVVLLVLLVAVPLMLVLSGCQDSGARPTPAPGPAANLTAMTSVRWPITQEASPA